MSNQTKIAVIGCGYWGKNLIRNFSSLGVLAAVCDTNKASAEKLATTYKVPHLPLKTILADPSITGIVIATPAAQHAELVSEALHAKKHVFVEKPLALKIADAKQLIELAKQKQRVLMVGHLLQYHPAFLELKELIKKGQLGKLQYIYSSRLNLGKFRQEETILWSFAPHDISMILSLTGALPEAVYATGACHIHRNIQDVTTTHLKFKNDIQGHIFVSWLHPFKEQKLVVVGDRGMAVFDDSLSWDQKLQLYPHQVNWIEGIPTPVKADAICFPLTEKEPLKTECQHFIDCITSNQTPCTDSVEGLRVLQVLDAAERSIKQNKEILIEDSFPLFYKHETAIIDENCVIEEGTKIWHFSHILKNTKIGHDCNIGQNVMIGPDVNIGANCKIQNNVSIYKGVTLEEGVFCGPSCVFTNVYNPRAMVNRQEEFRLTYVEKGVTIGANATIVCGVRLGAYCFIGAGAVVTKDVKPHALMVGNPARQIGWMSHAGEKLDANLVCPREGRKYRLTHDNSLEEMVFESVAS